MGKHKKSSKSHTRDKKRENHYRSSSSSSSAEEEWVEAEQVQQKHTERKRHNDDTIEMNNSKRYRSIENETSNSTIKRDEWMNLSTSFSSYSNIDRRADREREKKIENESRQYDPRKCPRELNPYWKNGGDGVPKFQKPKDDLYRSDSKSNRSSSSRYNSGVYKRHESKWRKIDESQSRRENSTKSPEKVIEKESGESSTVSMTELNVLAGKILKAELMGNLKLANELKEKLDCLKQISDTQDTEVLLTQTDKYGRTVPLKQSTTNYDRSGNSRRPDKKKVMDTHRGKERQNYYHDDDKYSLNQLFENEKFNSTDNQDREFMKIATRVHKNDDMDDLFVDNARRTKSDSKTDEYNRNKAINDHKRLTDSLDRCTKCIQSNAMPKHLMVSLGEYTYLSVPAHEPLTDGHCFISPIRHTSCITQLDENEWDEILNFRKALVKMFQSRDEDVVFFECANHSYGHPHMILECVPLPKEEGEMAPIYFKKAIDESEYEWAQNKKLVSLKGRDVRKAIPKGLPYFSVSFGMEEGFAHVIEDEKSFPRNFAQEIIGGMLDLHHSKWRKPQRQSFNDQNERVTKFSEEWKNFDITANL